MPPGLQLQRLEAYLELTKPRITGLVLVTTAAGFYMASSATIDLAVFFHVLLGTAIVAAASAVLNQFLERESDAKMERTSGRPLPSGRLEANRVLWFGLLLATGGVLYLLAFTNVLAATLAALTAALYVLLYTPLKKKTSFCTTVGAFPGAIPPLIGWAALRGELNLQALTLFAILFFWQFPHFLAIGWRYKAEYERAGLIMLPAVDPLGRKTGRRIVFLSIALVVSSILPWVLTLTGSVYLMGAAILGTGFLAFALRAVRPLTSSSARELLKVTVIYLPLLLLLRVLAKA